MRLDYDSAWKLFVGVDTYKQFVERYKLQDIFYTKLKEKTQSISGKEVTKENMFELFNEAIEITSRQGQPNDPYYLLENLATRYLIDNDLFDQVFFIETTDNDTIVEVNFYNIVPNDQADLKRYIEKHLDACKDGFSEVVEDVIERRSRNTPK